MSIDRLGAHWRRMGVDATWTPADYTAGATGKVMFDTADLGILGDRAQSTDYAVLFETATFDGLDTGDTMTIASIDYTVRNVELLDDGQIARATLSKNA